MSKTEIKPTLARLAVALVTLVMPLMQHCYAETVDECIYPHPTFVQDVHEAVVSAQAGSRVPIYRVYPPLCSRLPDRFCTRRPYLIPGNHVQVSRRCGSWIFSRFLGKHQTTEGWVEATKVYGTLPPDSASASQPPVNLIALPECAHKSLATIQTTNYGVLRAPPDQEIVVRRRNPLLCTSPDAGLCGVTRRIRSGITAFYSDTCGSWVLISPWAPHDSRFAADWGWVRAADLRRLVSPVTHQIVNPGDSPFIHDPLYLAVRFDKQKQVRRLVASGRNLNSPIRVTVQFPNGPRTYTILALSEAIELKELDMVKLLLSLGAEPNSGPSGGCSLVAALGQPDMVKALIHAGAPVNCDHGGPVRIAAGEWQGSAPLASLKELIAAHADMNIDDGAPLSQAIQWNNIAAAKVLVAAGANPNIQDFKVKGIPPLLMQAIQTAGLQDPTMLLILLNGGADPNHGIPAQDFQYYPASKIQDLYGESPLTAAAEAGYFDVVKMLLEHGADPIQAGTGGKSPAELAAEEQGHWDVAALIANWNSTKSSNLGPGSGR